MSHKIFEQIHTNREENFYGEFHLAKSNKKYTDEIENYIYSDYFSAIVFGLQ